MFIGGGPWMGVMGGVFTDKFIVQPLTPLLWMGVSSAEESARVYHTAAVMFALRESLKQLKVYYEEISKSLKTPHITFSPTQTETHPRFYPYPNSFVVGDKTFEFHHLKPLENAPTCQTFLAKLKHSEPDEGLIVVKFVSRYGEEVHKFLAGNDYAPKLRYYSSLPGAPPSPPRPKNAPAGMAFGFMQMVVMDYIDPIAVPPTNAREQLANVLTLLHSQGYVFGDLQEHNVLFDAHKNIKLIDFNWCGRYDLEMAKNSEDYSNIPPEFQRSIDEKKGTIPTLSLNEYAHYPDNLSTCIIWPAGVEALNPILPQHDWAMWSSIHFFSRGG
jgi:hypothetical protein